MCKQLPYIISAAAASIYITGVCCLMPALLLYFLGYQARVIDNQYLMKTNCKIVGDKIYGDQCAYQCDCYSRCTSYGKNGCNGYITTCSTCYYTCYDGSIAVDYIARNSNYTSEIDIYSGYRSEAILKSDLNANYAVGSLITCYYDSRKVTSVSLSYESTTVYLVFFGIFIALGIIMLISLLGFLLYWFLKDSYNWS